MLENFGDFEDYHLEWIQSKLFLKNKPQCKAIKFFLFMSEFKENSDKKSLAKQFNLHINQIK